MLEGFEDSFGGVDVGLAQLGPQGDVAAEAVERQVAVALVVAVEEAAFLAAVDRVVGGVEVEGDDAAPARDAPDALVYEEVADAPGVGLDLLGLAQAVGAEFEAVEGAFPGEGLAAIHLAALFAEEVGLVAAQRENRVEPELVVVVDVFVAEGDRVDALG
ncbi:MAG: hypothetical protein ACI9NC_005547 [Verrucomicrobiales bacterium]